jgi:hypothetical protein
MESFYSSAIANFKPPRRLLLEPLLYTQELCERFGIDKAGSEKYQSVCKDLGGGGIQGYP